MSFIRLLSLIASILIIHNETVSALRVLAIYPFAGKSHSIGAEHLLKEMTRRGHSVDVVSHFPQKEPIPNYRDISLRGSLPIFANNVTYDMITEYSIMQPREFVELAGISVCELLGLPVLQELMEKPKGTYDVIIVHLFAAHCYIGFGQKLNAPVVGVVTSRLQDWLFDPFANPLNPSYIPSFFSTFTQHMTFWERLQNTLITDSTRHQFRYWLEAESLQVEKYFGRRISSLYELYKDVSLVLVNEHFSSNDIKPATPDIIDVGGLHIYDNTQQLTPELQDWLDGSTEGCVSFTFGSNVIIESFPKELLKAFYQSFKRIAPVRVLMKGDPKALVKDLPKNVKILPWIPQIAVLKHKNVKAFITHGGLLGTQEAIAHKVPMIGIPLFGDQYTNMQNYANRGIAVVLDVKTLNENSLTNAINTVLKDPTYRKNIAKMSALFWDRPMSPVDTAIYWIEYAATHGPVLKSPATELSWWKFYSLDVYGFMLMCILTIIYTIIKLITLLCRCSRTQRKKHRDKMSLIKLLPLFASLLIIQNENASALRVLGIFPFPGRSHTIDVEHLLKEMSRRGHTVDLISHFPQKKALPNYRDISLRGSLPMIANNVTFGKFKTFNSIGLERFIKVTGTDVCDLLDLPVLQKLMETPKGTYDVIIVELFVSHCYIGFGQKLKAPVVGFVTTKLADWLFAPFAIPLNPSYMPSMHSGLNQRMTFWERLQNTLLIDSICIQFDHYLKAQVPQVEKYFGRRISSIDELYNDVSLVLVNEYFSTNDIKPATPDIIDVGGLHIYDDPQQLTPEVQDWLDESTEGCVYFTFGSTVNLESFPKELLNPFYQSFERIAPVRVLMRGDPKFHLKDLPKNVKILPWIPQIAVLKHKKVKAFITHGGLLGTQEAIAHKVPMIGIPLFADQHNNMRNYENRGIAVVLDLKTLNENSLTNAINTVLKDPTYRKNIAKISALFWDRPMSPVDTAIYWIEYAARHGPVLKSPATELSWWKLNLLDVYGFMLMCVLAIIYTIIKLITLLCRCASGTHSKNVSKAKKHR
ncbi:uncharacterized protein LOC107044539 [Diachasma alloeum]|uniref:uncharacterized protein LOC107044539 n=1 Tax=Diachasma alloeum TaxID=454923 RepID=UPI0007382406|nr:uncharacterized protein LOC107044539 [Diachasma alloeum]